MAEYIEREALIKSIASKKMDSVVPNCYEPEIKKAVCSLGQAIKKIINNAPAADVVEVVRCKECRHKVVTKDGEYNPHDIVCEYHMSDGFDETDYCSYGAKNGEKPLLHAYMEEIIDATD